MNASGATSRLLWIDPQAALLPEQCSSLRAAGLEPVCLGNDAPPGAQLAGARAVVLRLDENGTALGEMQSLLGEWQCRLPIICRVPPAALDLGITAMHRGAAHVLADDDWRPHAWSSAAQRLAPPASAEEFVFVDPLSRALLELARRVAHSDVTALLTGPTGSGKEVLARILHEASPRRAGPFVAINCAALPESMIEDLLFGHEKGAFTGALREHAGVFEQAHGGSLFLDEIGDMPQGLQVRLLRVLQEREVTRLGGKRALPVDVRLIAATNKDLRAALQAGAFREDLYFRISTFRLRIAPLRERVLDILPLARLMLQRHTRPGGHWHISERAGAVLQAHPWPGNVRELCNVMQRAMVLANGSIDVAHLVFDELSRDLDPAATAVADTGPEPAHALPLSSNREQPVHATDHPDAEIEPVAHGAEAADVTGGAAGSLGLDAALRSSEQRVIAAALREAPSRSAAARALGISPRTLRYKLAQMRAQGIPLNSSEGR